MSRKHPASWLTVLNHFMPETSDVDVMIDYRADDSYFSFAEDFVNNTISLRDLNMAMKLGMLGEQVVRRLARDLKCDMIELLD